ncbi:iron-containing alcohol dehydrogenase, partial [uncultured Porphyromonas sp.]|uniref:iron-containing alcohol dehydrogenase n=1 Tax=uncultured Porphyromonas sp. TaxID=159274 RepID=UPI002618AF07
MKNFVFCNPTKLIFGQGSIQKISQEVPEGSKILLTYGGGSIIKNGIYDQVMAQLKGFEVIPFGGIESNPDA